MYTDVSESDSLNDLGSGRALLLADKEDVCIFWPELHPTSGLITDAPALGRNAKRKIDHEMNGRNAALLERIARRFDQLRWLIRRKLLNACKPLNQNYLLPRAASRLCRCKCNSSSR
jgi:hypothetical protein